MKRGSIGGHEKGVDEKGVDPKMKLIHKVITLSLQTVVMP